MKKRQTSDWLESFLDYTNVLPSPEVFRKWVGISMLSAALERKVWVKTMGSPLYPNMYIVLVAPPGVGKTAVTSKTGPFWQRLKEHHMAPSNVSKASLVDCLNEANREIMRPGEQPGRVNFNSLYISSNELGVLLPSYDGEFMNVLTDIYDCFQYKEKKRTAKTDINIHKAQFNILAATTPAWLAANFPEGAWDQGFASRVMFVYSGQLQRRSLFAEEELNTALYTELNEDLEIIGSLYGQMGFTPEAAELIDAWHMSGCEPAPTHPRLINYSTRRTAHLLKLCQVLVVSRGCKLEITVSDFERALGLMIEIEQLMPDIFKALSAGSSMDIMKEIWHYVYTQYAKTGKAIPEAQIVQFATQKVPIHSIDKIMEIMQKTNFLVVDRTVKGVLAFKPGNIDQ